MGIASDFQSLQTNILKAREKETLLLRIDDLLRFLGSPGDWGYETKLGELTLILRAQRDSLAEAE